MLKITVPGREMWDEAKQEFIYTKDQDLLLEHSLLSISKWESKWCKPYLSNKEKTIDETLDYIKCMTITPNVNPDVYIRLSSKNVEEIINYINAPMTATTFTQTDRNTVRGEQITADLIYYYMVTFRIPFECEKWHINRLITLIRVCSEKSQPAKKMSKGEIMRRNAELNAKRKKELNTRG